MREVHCNLQIYRKYEVYVKLKVTMIIWTLPYKLSAIEYLISQWRKATQ